MFYKYFTIQNWLGSFCFDRTCTKDHLVFKYLKIILLSSILHSKVIQKVLQFIATKVLQMLEIQNWLDSFCSD
jgi:hypothetical protein